MSSNGGARNPGHPRKSSTHKMSVLNPNSFATNPKCVAEAPRKLPSSKITLGLTSFINLRNTVVFDPHPRILSFCRRLFTCGGGKFSKGETPSYSLLIRNFRMSSCGNASSLQDVWKVIKSLGRSSYPGCGGIGGNILMTCFDDKFWHDSGCPPCCCNCAACCKIAGWDVCCDNVLVAIGWDDDDALMVPRRGRPGDVSNPKR